MCSLDFGDSTSEAVVERGSRLLSDLAYDLGQAVNRRDTGRVLELVECVGCSWRDYLDYCFRGLNRDREYLVLAGCGCVARFLEYLPRLVDEMDGRSNTERYTARIIRAIDNVLAALERFRGTAGYTALPDPDAGLVDDTADWLESSPEVTNLRRHQRMVERGDYRWRYRLPSIFGDPTSVDEHGLWLVDPEEDAEEGEEEGEEEDS